MALSVALATVTQLVALIALAVLIGGSTLDVAMPVRLRELSAARMRLRLWIVAAAVALLLASAAELVIRSRTMTGGDVAAALGAVPTVLARTHFGRIWLLRGAALALVCAVVLFRAPGVRALAPALAVLVALTTSLAGHAADHGDVSVAVALDWVHVVAAGAWTGGLVCLGLLLRGRARTWSPSGRAWVIGAFSQLAGWCLLGVVLTGVYNVWTELPGPAALWTTGYGRALALKLLAVACLVWLGALNRYTVVPRLAASGASLHDTTTSPIGRVIAAARSRSRDRDPGAALASYLRREAILALAVFGCTAVLVDSEPPHRGHEHHPPHSQALVATARARSPGAAIAAHGERHIALDDMTVDGEHAVAHRVPAGLDR